MKSFTKTVSRDPGFDQAAAATLKKLWKVVAPPRVQIFLWFLLQGGLNTKNRLRRLNILQSEEDKCMFCGDHNETIEHLFISCRIEWLI